MAKEIRTIKRDLWRSDDFNGLSRDARLTWLAIISYADDHGRFKADPRELWAFAWLHYGDMHVEDVGHHLAEMVERGMIRPYSVEGREYFEIPTWSKHQRVDNASKSPIPEPRGDSPQPAANGGDAPRVAAGGEGKGEEGRGDAAARGGPPPRYCSAHPTGTTAKCARCKDARLDYEAWQVADATRGTPTPQGLKDPSVCAHWAAKRQHESYCGTCDTYIDGGAA